MVLAMDELYQEQLVQDVLKIAKDYANEQQIKEPSQIALVMEGIRLGLIRGMEIARNVSVRQTQNQEGMGA